MDNPWNRYPTEWFVKSIESIRERQKTYPVGSKEWEEGNRRAAPLEKELARRQAPQ